MESLKQPLRQFMEELPNCPIPNRLEWAICELLDFISKSDVEKSPDGIEGFFQHPPEFVCIFFVLELSKLFLFLLYIGAGIYMILIAAGLIHPSFLRNLSPHSRSSTRMALLLFGIGLVITSCYQSYVYYVMKPKIDAQRIQRDLRN